MDGLVDEIKCALAINDEPNFIGLQKPIGVNIIDGVPVRVVDGLTCPFVLFFKIVKTVPRFSVNGLVCVD